ncbi:MAG: hypothetical protein HFJ10_04395 [Lachnospiraceae bacterium]|nr:hypothetical protein [Lachnospiraceae bacterium]
MEVKSYLETGTEFPVYQVLREQGIAEGKAEFLLEALSDYGTVPIGIREQIMHQTNFSQLERWFLLARQVRSIEEFINRM